jgi:hypothetical protein
MKHIRQINSVVTNSYTVVITDNYIGELENHPILIQFPNDFEISEDELPAYIQYVNYE